MLIQLLRTALAVAATLALAACSSSTGPHRVTPAQLALHMDSLAVAAGSQPHFVDAFRLAFFGQAEAAPANGALPVEFTVTTRSGPQTWQGFVIRYSGHKVFGAQYDSVFFLFAYRDYTMKDVIVGQTTYFSGEGPFPQIWFLSDTTADAGGSGTLSMQTKSSGTTCPPVVTGLKDYWAGNATTCNQATFLAALSWTLPSAAGETADFATVSITSHQFNGVILQ
jgi:hypothetical protein